MKPLETGSPAEPDGAADLLAKIHSRVARVGVIGMGYVGLPTMVAAAEAGFTVVGIDISEDQVARINAGHSYIADVPDDVLKPLVAAGKVSATTDYVAIRGLDVVLVCVPTPITKNKEPDLTALENAISSLSANTRAGQLVVLQSTTFPGTTEEFVLPRLETPDYKVGVDFFLAFALERIDPGNTEFEFRNVPKVLGGVTQQCTGVAADFFSSIVDTIIPVGSPKVAEMTKLFENTFRSVNIALVNELAMLSHRMGIDIWEVIEAASTKPFGFMPFYPGPGVGGHCIPVDPFYLAWKAKEYDFYVDFIQLAAETNDNMPYYTLSRISEIMSDHGSPLKGARLLVLGVTFKENTTDTRNSPAFRVMELLMERGADVQYSDCNVATLCVRGQTLKSLTVDADLLGKVDAVLVLLRQSEQLIAQIVDNSQLVIDARNATAGMDFGDNVVKLW